MSERVGSDGAGGRSTGQAPKEDGSACSALPSTNDPILAWRRRIAATALGGAAAVAACAWWALRGPTTAPAAILPAAPPQDPPGVETPEAPGPLAWDAAVFDVALWNPPPRPPPPAPAVAERVEPLRLQLLGIVTTADGLRAALYDPQDDRIHLVSDGGMIGAIGVVRVGDGVVELADGRRTHVLRTREEEPPSLPGGRR